MNDRGQALIEFVIILPILLFILLYIIDFTRVGIKRFELESDMNLVVDLYLNKKNDELSSYVSSHNILVDFTNFDDMTIIVVSSDCKYNMPFLNSLLGNKISLKRTVYNEQ